MEVLVQKADGLAGRRDKLGRGATIGRKHRALRIRKHNVIASHGKAVAAGFGIGARSNDEILGLAFSDADSSKLNVHETVF